MRGQRGYMLITLMLLFTLIAIAALAVLPAVHQQWQRDREDELRHRGTMYMRAIQHYYRKLGRYPNSIDDLENSNHIRYLRKRYKDPMSWDPQTHKEKDFKLLHMQDVMLNNGPALGGIPGIGGQTPGAPGGAPSAFGNQPGGFGGSFGGASQLGGGQGGTGFGANGGGQSGSFGQSSFGQGGGQGGGAQTQPAADNNGQPGSGSPNSGGSDTDSSGTSNPANPGTPGATNTGPGGAPGPNGQTFGAGAILGVASTNKKDKAIHEFNKKTKYTEWYFIYDKTSDRGGLLVGPWQPLTIPSGGGIGQPIGAPGAPGQGSQTGFGQSSSGFGQQSGSGQQSGFGQSSGFGQQNPPNQQPQNPPQNQ
jgi:type II secretory pathway pseudopilin PulG